MYVLLPVLLLVLVTAVWGATFVLVKDAIAQYPTLTFLGLRFLLAAVVLFLVVRALPSRRVMAAGIPIGLALAAGYLAQTVGLQTASPANAGLITGLFVVFTPLVDGVFGRRIPLRSWVAVVVALAGTACLTGGITGLGAGDVLVLVCALCFALHIVMLSRLSPGLPSAPLALVQMAVAGILFGVTGAATYRAPSGLVLFALAVTGILASAAAFLVQTWAQQRLSATRTALVLASEPAWAVLFAVLLAGQRLGPLQAVGAAIVIAAIIGHEVMGSRAETRPAGVDPTPT